MFKFSKKLKRKLKKIEYKSKLGHLGVFLASFLLVIGTYEAPKIKREMLRDYVASKVVKLSNLDDTTGGTGFFVKLPSGKIGILTNAHVCGIAKEFTLYVKLDESRKVPAHILEVSETTDLCLIDGYGATDGLAIGNDPEKGETLYSLGHPALLPTSMTSGEYTDSGEIELIHHVMESPDDKCEGPNFSQRLVRMFIFEFNACMQRFDVLFTTVPSYPGNSGSPVVDKHGKVRGITFAGDSRINWAILLSAETIKKFIQPY